MIKKKKKTQKTTNKSLRLLEGTWKKNKTKNLASNIMIKDWILAPKIMKNLRMSSLFLPFLFIIVLARRRGVGKGGF